MALNTRARPAAPALTRRSPRRRDRHVPRPAAAAPPGVAPPRPAPPAPPAPASAWPLTLVERAGDASPPQSFSLHRAALEPSQAPPQQQQPGADDASASAAVAPAPLPSPFAAALSYLQSLLLPPGYPSTVSPDYLGYVLLALPTHATGAACHALATAALLRAVAPGSEAAAPALSAGLKFALKDGLGSAGRLVVAGRVARLLDSAPRQWRLYAELVATAGGALEVATPLAPAPLFLPLAAAGTLLRASAKAMAGPAHAVLLQHFAVAGNLGAVAAKEEVQEVAAQACGLALSALLLSSADGGGGGGGGALPLASAWAVCAAAHLALRWRALAGVRFRTLNARRACAAAAAHALRGEPPSRWASFAALNAREPLAAPDWAAPLSVALGARLADAVPPGDAAAAAALRAAAALLPPSERFLLVPRPGGWFWRGGRSFLVLLREHARPSDCLRAVWLAAAVQRARRDEEKGRGRAAGAAGGGDGGDDGGAAFGRHLAAALADARAGRFAEFERSLEAEGWDAAPLLPCGSDSPRLV